MLCGSYYKLIIKIDKGGDVGKKVVVKEKCNQCGKKFCPEEMSKDNEKICAGCAMENFFDVAFGLKVMDIQK